MAQSKGKPSVVADEIADAARFMGPAAIEAEKLRLEIERLKLEKERLEAGVNSAVSQYGRSSDSLTFRTGTVCVVAAVCLLLGGIIGFTTGMDIGIRKSPIPQKILVSKNFIRALESHTSAPTPPPRDPPPWIPRQPKNVPTDLVLVR